MDSFIPDNVVYAGLVGCLVALVVATAQQNWKPRVFFLLLLRVAIGWQFLSEGLNKVQSHYVGASETSKPFSSEPYFRESEGPISPLMRRLYLDDPEQKLYELTRPTDAPVTAGDVLGADGLEAVKQDFAKVPDALIVATQHAPKPPAGTPPADFPAHYAKAVAGLPLNGAGSRFLADYLGTYSVKPAAAYLPGFAALKDAGKPPPALPAAELVDRKVLAQVPPAARTRLAYYADQVLPKLDGDQKLAAESYLDAARRTYARWALGLDTSGVKKKYVSGDLVQTVPMRLADYENRKKEFDDLKARRATDIGRSTLFARIAAAKADMTAVRTELVKDADDQLADARADLGKLAGTAPADPDAGPKKIDALDFRTMWMLTVAGACLMIGLGTRLAAVVCGVFLVMTYLTYPAFPWLPNPPGTEGNPVFVNKNLIEAFACFALASLPTGRWLGVDALIHRMIWGERATAVTA